MNGGEISGNTSNNGGGVYVYSSGSFTMNSGKISGNTSRSNGGGVHGKLIMSNGEISGNTSEAAGGGVYVNSFNKTGGIIYGYTEGNNKSNIVIYTENIKQNSGHAIYIPHNNSIYIMGKDSTSGPTDNLSFDGTVTPPVWSGEWDF